MMEIKLIAPFSAFLTSCVALLLLHPFARKVGLVDIPNKERKDHHGHIPLIGGISIMAGLAMSFFVGYELFQENRLFIITATVVVGLGVIDDYMHLNAKLRLVIQLILASILTIGSGITINHFGQIFGPSLISLNDFSIPFTILAIVAAINAFNMIDGIDGLLGSFGIIALSTLSLLFYLNGAIQESFLALCLAISCLPFLAVNLEFTKMKKLKSFMGDAGSMMIGLSVIWLISYGVHFNHTTQSNYFEPVMGLFIMSVPLMDMALVMLDRKRNGKSPFQPDRTHLHHLLIDLGMSRRVTLLAMIGIYSGILGFGLIMNLLQAPQWLSFISFLAIGMYYAAFRHFLCNRIKWYRNLLNTQLMQKVRLNKQEVK